MFGFALFPEVPSAAVLCPRLQATHQSRRARHCDQERLPLSRDLPAGAASRRLLPSGSRSASSRRGVCGYLYGPKTSRARLSLPPQCQLLVPLNARVESCGSGRGNAGCLPGTAVQWRKNCLCRTCRWSLLLFFAGEKEKPHPARWRVQLLATYLLELVLLLRSGPAACFRQGRGRGIPQIRVAGGSRGKVCSRRAGGALEGSGWWLLVPVSWVNF